MSKALRNVKEGCNPDIMEARNCIPEPSRTEKVLIVVEEKKEVIKSDIIYVVNFPPNKFEFRKALIRLSPTCKAYVWVCTKDGKMYF